MSALWQTNIGAATEWVDGLIAQTANARSWTVAQEELAMQIAAESEPTTWESIWADPEDYYAELAAMWSAQAPLPTPEGWDELGRTWASAGSAAYSAAEETRLGSPVTLVSDTVVATGEDFSAAGESGLAFFSPTKTWLDPSGFKFWIPVVGISAGVYLWKK